MKEVFDVGDVVQDNNYGYTGIVVGFNEKPDKWWINMQAKKFICQKDTQYLTVFPFDGGSVTLSSETTKLLRKATLNDFQKAYREANKSGAQQLLKTFLGLDLEVSLC